MDLHAERYDVRQSAKRNTFTGKTYNSLENISQFFGERGMPFKPAASRRRRRMPPPPHSRGPPAAAARQAAAPAAAAAARARAPA